MKCLPLLAATRAEPSAQQRAAQLHYTRGARVAVVSDLTAVLNTGKMRLCKLAKSPYMVGTD